MENYLKVLIKKQKLLDFKSVSTKQVNQLSLLSKELCKDIQIKKSLIEKNSNLKNI